MTVYVENPKQSTKVLLELISAFNKVAECKTKIQKSIACVYACKEQVEIELNIYHL